MGQTSFAWSHIAIGAIWGTCLGLLSVPLSMPKDRGIFANLVASLVVSLTLVATGTILGWTADSVLLAAFIGALLGLMVRWWAPLLSQ